MTTTPLGYACITELSDLSCSRRSTRSYLERQTPERAEAYLRDKVFQNLNDLPKLLIQNHKNRIRLFRLPEDLFPQWDLGYYDWRDYTVQLQKIGKLANRLKISLTTHPSQYFLLATTRQDVVNKSIAMFNFWADVFDVMALDVTPIIVTHVGGLSQFSGDHKLGCDAWIHHYQRLSASAKRYIAVENDQNSYSIEHCMYIHDETNVPVIFDSEHFIFNSGTWAYDYALLSALGSWGDRTPKVHLSSQDPDQTRHAHADYVDTADYMRMLPVFRKSKLKRIYVMLETKKKDASLLRLRFDLKNQGVLRKG